MTEINDSGDEVDTIQKNQEEIKLEEENEELEVELQEMQRELDKYTKIDEEQ